MAERAQQQYDVAIVGGGPAGLSAAIVLGRARRRVVLLDDGQPRNAAAQIVNCFLGVEEASPRELRERGRRQARGYGVELLDARVEEVSCEEGGAFRLVGKDLPGEMVARKLLLATGTRDMLPPIENLREAYGKSVHHCPYCDGWEHRDERLVAWGESPSVVKLAVELKNWSSQVVACSHGQELSADDEQLLARNGIPLRSEEVVRMEARGGQLQRLEFAEGEPLECDALFFSAGQTQRSQLPMQLGCECDEQGLICTGDRQGTGVPGLFLAGDADGDVQFAIVAAAKGAVAATAINRELQEEEIQ